MVAVVTEATQAPLHTGCGAVGNAATAGEAEQAEAGRMSTWVDR